MKVVLLAGGLGTRLSELTTITPKPMVEIGNMPILWHIMKIYSYYGHNDFIICAGYKADVIKKYFANFALQTATVVDIDTQKNEVVLSGSDKLNWKIKIVDTGLETMVGGRLKRIESFLKDEKYFALTYGDGLCDVNINSLINFHEEHNKMVTVTAVQPDGRFGALDLTDDNIVSGFVEKPVGDGGWINGGYFIVSPKALDYITGDDCVWEQEPLRQIAESNELRAFKHYGFWQPMDTLKDKQKLQALWNNKSCPWRIW